MAIRKFYSTKQKAGWRIVFGGKEFERIKIFDWIVKDFVFRSVGTFVNSPTIYRWV